MIRLINSVPSVCVRDQRANRKLQTFYMPYFGDVLDSKPWIEINMINTKHCYYYFIILISSIVSSYILELKCYKTALIPTLR